VRLDLLEKLTRGQRAEGANPQNFGGSEVGCNKDKNNYEPQGVEVLILERGKKGEEGVE
jgi:hypothetical protein